MATQYTRPRTAGEHFSIEKFNRSGLCYKAVIVKTVAKTDFGSPTYKVFNDRDFTDEIITSGAPLQIKGQVGILLNDTKDGDLGYFAVEFDAVLMPLKAADAPAIGDKLYWDGGAHEATTTATGNTFIGFATKTKEVYTTGNKGGMPPLTFIELRKTFSQ